MIIKKIKMPFILTCAILLLVACTSQPTNHVSGDGIPELVLLHPIPSDMPDLIFNHNINFDEYTLPDSNDIFIEKSVYIDSSRNIFRTITLHARRLPNSIGTNLHEYEVNIIIVNEEGYITQQIHDLPVSYQFLRQASWDIEIDIENPLNFHLADYDGDGYLDMGLRASPGGSLMNDPHYIWLWDNATEQFVRSEELERISWGGSIELGEEGYIHSSFRITSGHYVWLEYSFSGGNLLLVRSKEVARGGYWERALLGADFVQSKMLGTDIREYVRIVENGRAYELFTLFCLEGHEITDFHETRLFISDIIDGEYHYLVSFEIPNRRANASGGLILLDVDFDGIKDVLVWLGHEGNQGLITYAAFLSRGDTYVETNFHGIPFPAIDNVNERFRGSIRSWAASHYFILYEFINDEFTATDSFNRALCRDTMKLKYTILSIDGQSVNEVLWYEYDNAKIYLLFYCNESRWGLGTDRWSIFGLH